MKKLFVLITLITVALVSAFSASTAVVYFSATGNTERVANVIAEETGADVFEIVPLEPYSRADLNWRDEGSRVWDEHREYPDARPELAEDIDLSSYDTVFLGYPLWWGEAPSIVLTFLESVDLEGKTIIPFCTSSSSGLGDSDVNLHQYQSTADWLDGQRFRSRVSDDDVREWLRGIEL